MKTIKSFCGSSNIPASLIRSVIRQVGGWDSFKELAQDVSNHGAGGGFSGFTYYTDTLAFTKCNKGAILTLAADLARDTSEGDEYQLITSFNCFKNYRLTVGEVARALHVGKGENVTSIYNALAWFALEEVARSYCDLCEG